MSSRIVAAVRALTFVAVGVMIGIVTCAEPVAAQQAVPAVDTAGPMTAVRELFDAMRAGDSARVRAVFHPQTTMLMGAQVNAQGEARIAATPLEAFVKTIGTPHPQPYDERLFNPVVHVDGTLASVWVEYSFYVGTQFSHCGIDAMLLAKSGASWKIIGLSDTRRTTGCTK
jgi:Putative lumazine-binding